LGDHPEFWVYKGLGPKDDSDEEWAREWTCLVIEGVQVDEGAHGPHGGEFVPT
jgi:hypothetical protein